MVTSPRNRYRTRYKVSVEKPRSSELRLSPTRANCNNQADFLSLLGLQKTVPQPKEPTMDNFQLRTCTVVVMCSRCDICKKWFKSSKDAEAHISQCHDEFEMAFAQSAPFKRRNKARRGKSMNKENRTVNVRRTSNRQKPIKHYDLGQFGELSETADTSRYKELPKTVVKKVKKPAVPKPRIIKRPLLLPPTLLQARMPVPMVDNDSDDDIQFCYEVKYNHEPTVQSDDDCAVVCEVVKEKPASITPDPSAPRYFQDPRITSSDSFTGPKMVVHPSQLCAVVTRRDQNNEKVKNERFIEMVLFGLLTLVFKCFDLFRWFSLGLRGPKFHRRPGVSQVIIMTVRHKQLKTTAATACGKDKLVRTFRRTNKLLLFSAGLWVIAVTTRT